MSMRLRFETDRRLEHFQAGWVGRGLGAAHLAENTLDFGKLHEHLVGLL